MRKRVKILVHRFNPERDTSSWYSEYEVEVNDSDTILSILLELYKQDTTLAFSYSCRRGVCGSCSVRVNDIPVLACRTTIGRFVSDDDDNVVVIEPIKTAKILRDLVVDKKDLWCKLARARPWLHRVSRYVAPEYMEKSVATKLQRYRDCSYCLICVDTCPVFELRDSFGGPLVLRILGSFNEDPRDGFRRDSVAFHEGVYECLVCDECTAVCPRGVPIGELILSLRRECFKNGIVPERVRYAVEAIKDSSYANPLWRPREERGEWCKGLKNASSSATILLYAGCMASYEDRESIVSLALILEKAGLKYNILGDKEYCCGMPLLLAGDFNGAREVASKNVEYILKSKAKLVVAPCPSCYRMMKELYPKYFGINIESMGVKVLHAVELLHELIENRKLRLRRSEEKVTYHDPCDLGRHMNIYSEPRELINKVSGGLIEMKRNREYARCCGAGGNLRIANPELSIEIGVLRMKQTPREAEVMLHACPTCKLQLKEASIKVGLNIKHFSIQEYILEHTTS